MDGIAKPASARSIPSRRARGGGGALCGVVGRGGCDDRNPLLVPNGDYGGDKKRRREGARRYYLAAAALLLALLLLFAKRRGEAARDGQSARAAASPAAKAVEGEIDADGVERLPNGSVRLHRGVEFQPDGSVRVYPH